MYITYTAATMNDGDASWKTGKRSVRSEPKTC